MPTLASWAAACGRLDQSAAGKDHALIVVGIVKSVGAACSRDRDIAVHHDGHVAWQCAITQIAGNPGPLHIWHRTAADA